MSARREELLAAALSYAEDDGWPVFPCHVGRKDPITPHGLKDATTDRRRILTWWRDQPFNIAKATGVPASDVLDVDIRETGSGWPAFNRLKRAGLLTGARALAETRSGGLHVHFAGTDQQCGRLRDHHLDFKSLGGYVLLPPSWVDADDNGPAGSYRWLDRRPGTATLDWAAVRRLLEPPRPRRQAAREDGDGSITRLIEWVARQNRSGDRHDPLAWAAFRLLEQGQLDDTVAADLVSASVRAGHDERDAWSCVRSIQRKAVAS
jgi:hypothetical protein